VVKTLIATRGVRSVPSFDASLLEEWATAQRRAVAREAGAVYTSSAGAP